MKKEIAEKWVKALRTGGYERSMGFLHYGDGFCPLGVLCDISGLGSWVPKEDRKYSFCYRNYDQDVDETLLSLPYPVMKWAGMRTAYGRLTDHADGLTIADINDKGQHGLEDIAKIIEEHWEEL